MTRKNTLDGFAISAMILLCAIWGFQQVAIKTTISEIPPVWQSALRSLAATVLIGCWILIKRISWSKGLVWPGLIAGFFFAAEFGLLYFALNHTDAARAALLLYTAPFVVAIGAHYLIPGERLSPLGWMGVAMAFLGTAVVMQASFDLDGKMLMGDLCAFGGGIAWGLTTLVIRTTGLSHAAPSQTLLFQLAVSGIILSLVAWAIEGSIALPQTHLAWSSIAYQAVFVATLSLLGWFALVTRYSATKLSVFTFMTPLFGALAGIIFLGETIDAYHIIALGLTMTGIVIVNLYGSVSSQGTLVNENA